MAARATATEGRPAVTTMGSGSSGSQATGRMALTATAVRETNEEDKARIEAVGARDKKRGEAVSREGYVIHCASYGKKRHTRNHCPSKYTYR